MEKETGMETMAALIERINDMRLQAGGDEETRVRLKRARTALAEALDQPAKPPEMEKRN